MKLKINLQIPKQQNNELLKIDLKEKGGDNI